MRLAAALLLTLALGCANDECEAAACLDAGGQWGRFGLMQTERCNLPTADAGAACRGDADCESFCVADNDVEPGTGVEGRCYDWTVELGTCLNRVENGTATGVICVD